MKTPVGQRIRKRRQELGQSQMAVAAQVGISASYLNLIEHNKRAIGGALLNRIAEAIDLDARALAGTEEARLIAELAEVAADIAPVAAGLRPEDAREIVATSPKSARAILALYRAYREARQRSDLIGERLGEDSFLAEASHQILALITTIRSYAEILEDHGDMSDAERRGFVSTLVAESETLANRATDMFDFMGGRGGRRPRPSPREEIEDFISDRANYFPRLEAAGEASRAVFGGVPSAEAIAAHLARRHHVALSRRPAGALPPGGEAATEESFAVAEEVSVTSLRFRLARRLMLLEHAAPLDALVAEAALTTADAGERLRRALASYAAAALLMPYAEFHSAAEGCRLDILRLARRFDASFEQVCHRLSTLRRPGLEGVPLHFLRTDVAGNISKRFSASGIRLPRYGGACPRWIIHHAFAWPGRIVSQVARMPDGETYFFIARTAGEPDGGVAASRHAVMIGAGIAHARRFAYADGIDLAAPSVVVPVGTTCRQCPRLDCAERAFDPAPLPGSPAGAVT